MSVDLASTWRRLTGANVEPIPVDGAAEYEHRLRIIEARLDLGKRELNELAKRVRVAEIALGAQGHDGPR